MNYWCAHRPKGKPCALLYKGLDENGSLGSARSDLLKGCLQLFFVIGAAAWNILGKAIVKALFACYAQRVPSFFSKVTGHHPSAE